MNGEITYEGVVDQVHQFARAGLWFGADPLEVLQVTTDRYGQFFGDHPDDLDDIVAYEVRRFGLERLKWCVDPPWRCAHCHRREAHESAIYVGWAFINSRTGEPYALCEECYSKFCAANATRQRQILDLVALRLARVVAQA